MADRPATPTLSRILSDPQTCADFSKKSHATFPPPVSKNFSSNHLILSSPFPPLLISTNSIDSRLREKKKKKTPVRDFPTTAYRLNPSISRIGLIPAPNFCNSRGRKKGGIEGGRVLDAQRAGSTWDAEEAPLVERQRRAKENRGGIEEREDGG